jgi:hypothetical protein
MAVVYRVSLPFDARSHLVVFLAGIVLALSLPFINHWFLRASFADVFRSVPPRYDNYRFMGNAIEAGGNVDVLVVGASDAETAFDTKVLSEELSARLGRPIRVLNFGANWYGAEALYARVQGALSNLKVKVVVAMDTFGGTNYPHELAEYWWLYPRTVMPASLTFRERATLYATTLLGAPRRSWADLRGVANLRIAPEWQSSVTERDQTLGFNGVRLGWLGWSARGPRAKYADLTRPVPDIPSASQFYRDATDDGFVYFYGEYTAYQTAFLKQIDQIVTAQGGIFAMVSTPVLADGLSDKAFIRPLWHAEPRSWPQFGIATARLFKGLSDEEAHAFYYNEYHLNASGAKLYSRAIAPALVKLLNDAEQR